MSFSYPFYLLEWTFISLFDSYHGNFKSLSILFQNIFWLIYKCGFIIWTLFYPINKLLLCDSEVVCFISNISETKPLTELLASSTLVMYIVGSGQTNG